ncbi:MAG: DUF4258 domain-containing protein [Pyrinomonadaceae bacterium]
MSTTFERIRHLVAEGSVRVSEHGYDELSADTIFAREAIVAIAGAILVEDYPDYPKGPCVLVLEKDTENKPIHVVWGIPKGHTSPAVLVTAYRPDPELWEKDFLRRKR